MIPPRRERDQVPLSEKRRDWNGRQGPYTRANGAFSQSFTCRASSRALERETVPVARSRLHARLSPLSDL